MEEATESAGTAKEGCEPPVRAPYTQCCTILYSVVECCRVLDCVVLCCVVLCCVGFFSYVPLTPLLPTSPPPPPLFLLPFYSKGTSSPGPKAIHKMTPLKKS